MSRLTDILLEIHAIIVKNLLLLDVKRELRGFYASFVLVRVIARLARSIDSCRQNCCVYETLIRVSGNQERKQTQNWVERT